MSGLSVERVATPDGITACLAIRRAVFINEQGVAEELEVDGLDAEAIHYLGRLDGRPVATARVRLVDGCAKVQRVAVLRAARGAGAGAAIMHALMADVARDPALAAPGGFTLGSQESAVPFYERLGFRVVGAPFMDAGIPHRTMVHGA